MRQVNSNTNQNNKMKKLITLAVFALTPVCFAEPGEGKKGKAPAHVIEKFDVDGDGELSSEERAEAKAFHKAKKEEMKAFRDSYDTNGDGELDAAEEEAFKAAREQKMIERFDKDGDGELNEEEQSAADKAKRHFKKMKDHDCGDNCKAEQAGA